MSEDLYKWLIGGFIALMAIFTKVAYSDPDFYLGFLEKKVSKVSLFLSIIIGSFWFGLNFSHNYAERKLNLSPEQSKLYSTDYNNFIIPLSLLYFALCIAYVYSFLLTFIADNKKRSTPR